ncbi:MAG: hypothetical protein ACI9XO_003275 [Paraglaciecola sp.]|jgi:hypothetical protein
MKKGLLTIFAIAIATLTMTAQINTPAASPSSKMEQEVGLTTVTVEYSRPSAKGRKIFAADGLVPYGEMWRTGANSATKVTFSDDVKVAGKDLKAGSYALLSKPGATVWNIHFHKYDKGSWSSYKDKTPVLAVDAKPVKMNINVESFLINIGDMKGNTAHLALIWENTMVGIPFEVEVDSKVEADIKKVMGGPARGDFYGAARYYYDNDKADAQALEWIQKANEMDAKYWQLRLESQILADMGKHIDAIAAAERSKEMAMKEDNKDYVRRNDASIKEWKEVLAKKSADKKSEK